MSTELLQQEQRIAPVTAMELLATAVQQGASIDTIERLARLQKEMRDDEARLQFDQAMHRAQAKIKRIGKDKMLDGKKWASLEKIDSVIRPICDEEGFSVSFDSAEYPDPLFVLMVAYVSHQQGHTRRYQLLMPADGKGAKGGDVMTRTHATGSAASYGRRYLKAMIWDIPFGETDDDGNSASLPESTKHDLIAAIEKAPTVEKLTPIYLTSLKAATESKDATLIGLLKMAADERKRVLTEKEPTNAGH